MYILRLIATSTLFLLTVTFAQAQMLPTKSEQYEFLGWYAKHNELLALSDSSVAFIHEQLLNEKSFLKSIKEYKKITSADIRYIKSQLHFINKSTKLDSSKLKGAIWKSDPKDSSVVSYISFPIFTLNKRIAFIYKAFYCEGDCGHETIEMYIKTAGIWHKSQKVHLPILMY